jgi:WD40 repeat protein
MPLCSFAGQKNGMAMQGTPHGVMSNPHTGPVMGCCWSPDGGKLFTGSADKTGKVWDLASSQVVQFAAHDQPIKAVHMVAQHNMVVTASWDKTLKYWPINTLGQGTPALTVNLSERVYAIDVKVVARVLVLRVCEETHCEANGWRICAGPCHGRGVCRQADLCL